jgi:hypothetical protein
MSSLLFNPAGSYLAAGWLGLGPLLIGLAVARQRRRSAATSRRNAGRWLWSLVLAPLLLYYGVLYWWLFYDQFYELNWSADTTWRLSYRLPSRSYTVAVADISDLRIVTGDLRTYRMARLQITTRDGHRWLSAQLKPSVAEDYLRQLQRLQGKDQVQS